MIEGAYIAVTSWGGDDRLATHRERLPRLWWLCAAAALAVLVVAIAAYVVITPVGEQSDELAHLNYARLIAHHLSLPTDGIQERQQPPLYYALVAVALKLSGDNLRAARWVSVVLTLGTAIVLVTTVRLLAPRRAWLALAALVMFALLPSVQYEGAQVSNDSLAWLAGALVILMLVVTLRRSQLSLAHCAAIGLAVGVAILAKATVWPLAALLLLALIVHHRRRLRPVQVGAVAIPAVAVCGWWVVRNLATYHRPLPPMTPITTPAEHTVRTARQLASWVSLSWKSTVGVEGPRQTPLVVGPGRVGLYLLFLAGLAIAAVVATATFATMRSWRRGSPGRSTAWLLAAPVLAVAFSLLNSVTLDDQPQARYLLVAATIWCAGTVWALSWPLSGRPRLAATLGAGAVMCMLLLDATTALTLRLVG